MRFYVACFRISFDSVFKKSFVGTLCCWSQIEHHRSLTYSFCRSSHDRPVRRRSIGASTGGLGGRTLSFWTGGVQGVHVFCNTSVTKTVRKETKATLYFLFRHTKLNRIVNCILTSVYSLCWEWQIWNCYFCCAWFDWASMQN